MIATPFILLNPPNQGIDCEFLPVYQLVIAFPFSRPTALAGGASTSK
jgi:hypothetical protein